MQNAKDIPVLPVSDPTLTDTPPIPADLRDFPIELTDNARTVLRKRYLRRGADGKPSETEQGMFWRVAYNIALAETEHGGTTDTVDQIARRFFHLLVALQFFPNSPTFTGAGTPLGQLAACFTADIRVTTSLGQKRIADLSVGDLVLTHNGRYQPVREVYQRPYDGQLLRMKIHSIGTTLEVTPEHPIMTPNGWVKAGELKKGDQVAVGQLRELSTQSINEVATVATSTSNRFGYAPVIDLDAHTYILIEQITSEHFEGTVYNCEVQDDHSYVTEGVVVHNCFVLAIDDDMGRTETGIFQTLRNAALIQQTGGGNGFAFSRLRPKGGLVRSSNGQATGPVGFLRVYDQAFGEIAQGGSRRGANMAVLQVDHPDVRDFITCKTDESKITNFNISVGITDEFMRQVEADGMYDLINPQDNTVWETVRAREIYDLIVKYAHHNGEPGVLFLDTANRHNPVPHLYKLESTNPCGEQWLGPFENCCLGSINVAKIATADGKVDWEKFRDLIETSTRFLDDVVTANKYVPAVPQLKEAAHRVRRIGLGIMGLGDLMYHLGVRYGSEEGQEFAAQISEFLRYHAMKTSVALAQERGAFPAIKGSIYDPENLTWQPPTPTFPFTRNWDRPALDWNVIVNGIKQYGIRNGAQTTVAPTGTIATVSGCEGYGCEPVFALAYIRHVNDQGKDLQLQYTSPLFEKALHSSGLTAEQIDAIITEVNQKGSCQDIAGLPESIRHTFVVSSDVSLEEHVRMQAAMQAFVDNAISKTLNAPESTTEADVAAAYMLGWKLGCKGMTVYVTGSRDKVVLETHATAQTKQPESAVLEATSVTTPEPVAVAAAPNSVPHVIEAAPAFVKPVKKSRPHKLIGRTYRVETPLGKTYVTINENGEGLGYPFEIFTHTSKAGSDTAAVSEAIGRLISLMLRLRSPLSSPRERLKEVAHELDGIGGGRPTGFGAARVRSLPDGIARVLQEYLDETEENLGAPTELPPKPIAAASQATLPSGQVNTPTANSTARGNGIPSARIIGDLCPECGEATLVNEEGCRKCYTCGYSEC